jgi:hypothetical protein
MYMNDDDKEYNLYTFRQNIREAFEFCDDGIDVYIKRFKKRYVLMTESYYKELLKPDEDVQNVQKIIKTPQQAKQAVQNIQNVQKLCPHGKEWKQCFEMDCVRKVRMGVV